MKSVSAWLFMCCAAVFFASSSATAQDAPGADPPPQEVSPAAGVDALTAYRQQAMGIRYRFNRGISVTQGGLPTGLGYFAGGYKDIFAGSDPALRSMRKYRRLRIIGLVLSLAGAGLVIGALVSESDVIFKSGGSFGDLNGAFWPLLISGLAVDIAGGVMVQVAPKHMTNAVEQYNDTLYQQLNGASSSVMARYRLKF